MLRERKGKAALVHLLVHSLERMGRGPGFREESDFTPHHILYVYKRDSGLTPSQYRKILLRNMSLKSGMGYPCQVKLLKRLDICNS